MVDSISEILDAMMASIILFRLGGSTMAAQAILAPVVAESNTYTLRRPLTMIRMNVKTPGVYPGPGILEREFLPGGIEAFIENGTAVVIADDLVWSCSEAAFLSATGELPA